LRRRLRGHLTLGATVLTLGLACIGLSWLRRLRGLRWLRGLHRLSGRCGLRGHLTLGTTVLTLGLAIRRRRGLSGLR
jgi:hypothetical protein